MTRNKVVIPGEIIFPSDETTRPGKGTYQLHGQVYASLAGYVYVKEEQLNGKDVRVIEVRRSEEQNDHVIPYIGGIVTVRVLNIGLRYAKCELLCVEDSPLTSEYSGMLRREDLRAHDKDKINLGACIQPGDVLLARVISFGDNQSSFILSTAEDQLGVVMAIGESGERMIPIDFHTVKGIKTGMTESRKVAQVPMMNSLNRNESLV